VDDFPFYRICFAYSFKASQVQHLERCVLAPFQGEAIGSSWDSKKQYATAGKQSTRQGFASAKALAGPFSALVD
jgi:hypothetical protein